jgi:hypothetical protein
MHQVSRVIFLKMLKVTYSCRPDPSKAYLGAVRWFPLFAIPFSKSHHGIRAGLQLDMNNGQ